VVTEEEQKASDQTEEMAYKTLNPDTIGDYEIVLGAYKAYWEDLAGYNPIEIAKKIEKPVFVFQGDRDYQVPVGEYNLIYEALSNRDNFMFKLYPGLNHLLMYGEEKSTPQEYYTKSTVHEPLLDDVIEFIK
jgi:dipeptidyl aminopeptidase/acylaminoacyl peptidase